ncbi:hypothetical protein PR048_020241 [Dryococelus australis]|uniref:Uncharacterized protein n=1 Tax=Dryococelus australis TaxID=614101 RepID=A0ABQ9H5R2_9NEOP|nr:hypothetical protein PR048_020241 [Dryococelus australis]
MSLDSTICRVSTTFRLEWQTLLVEALPKSTISQTHSISPQFNEELLWLRLVMHNFRGSTSFQDIRTVRNSLLLTFKEACMDLLLLDQDDIYKVTLFEAATWSHPWRLRVLLPHSLFHCNISDLVLFYNRMKLHLVDIGSDDYAVFNKTLKSYGLPAPDESHPHDIPQYYLDAESEKAGEMSSSLNTDQRNVFNQSWQFIYAELSLLMDLAVRVKPFCKIASFTAFELKGKIAVLLSEQELHLFFSLEDGIHTHFSNYLVLCSCKISAQSAEADIPRCCSLIIWDETPMAPK